MSVGALLDLQITRKAFAGRCVLSDLHLCLANAEAVAIMGPSGRGKSTLLAIAAGTDTAFEGKRQLAEGTRVAVVFQEPRLLPWRSAWDNIALCHPPGGVRAIEHALAAVGLTEAASLFPGQLSLGMQRRVSLARALSMVPDLLILDEAFASLDAQTAHAMRTILTTERTIRPFALLMATHSPEDAALADRVIEL